MIQEIMNNKSRIKKIIRTTALLFIIVFCSINIFSESYNKTVLEPSITTLYRPHNAILYNGALRTEGKHNKGILFNNTDNYIDLETSVFYEPRITEFTIQSWVKLENKSNNNKKTIFYEGNSLFTSGNFIWLFISESSKNNSLSLGYYQSDNETNYINYNFNAKSDTWYNIAVTFNNGNIKYYIDGINVLNKTSTNHTYINRRRFRNHYIGMQGEYNDNKETFHGTLDDFRIWETELNKSQINIEMNSSLPIYLKNIILSYNFEENSSINTIFDVKNIKPIISNINNLSNLTISNITSINTTNTTILNKTSEPKIVEIHETKSNGKSKSKKSKKKSIESEKKIIIKQEIQEKPQKIENITKMQNKVIQNNSLEVKLNETPKKIKLTKDESIIDLTRTNNSLKIVEEKKKQSNNVIFDTIKQIFSTIKNILYSN